MTGISSKSGFTLIETLVAIVILTIAVFALYGLQTTAIRGNATARSLTTASNWARSNIEQLLAQDYEDLADGNGTNDGCAGLDDMPTSDGSDLSDPIYQVYWNIANDCTLVNIPAATQIPKHIRVIVTRDALGVQNKLVFDYIKQNTI